MFSQELPEHTKEEVSTIKVNQEIFSLQAAMSLLQKKVDTINQHFITLCDLTFNLSQELNTPEVHAKFADHLNKLKNDVRHYS